MVLQMEDRKRVVHKEIIKDILIKVHNFIIPTDFIITFYDADCKALTILGSILCN